jgi:hypothetical protein
LIPRAIAAHITADARVRLSIDWGEYGPWSLGIGNSSGNFTGWIGPTIIDNTAWSVPA